MTDTEPTDVHSVKPGDFIKADGEMHEITSIDFRRDGRGRARNWNVNTKGGRRFNMLEINSYHRKLDKPQDIRWVPNGALPGMRDIFVGDREVGWLEPRPAYCDRGHWKLEIQLPDIDHQDGFPRYFMLERNAIEEAEAFLRWRLWKQRAK